MDKVKYRLNDPRLAPRRTRLEIPGWSGKREPRANGSREQVWHCVPFSEGAQYGIELFYPYDNDLHVTTKEGHLILEGDWGEPPDSGVQWPPFRNFGDSFYTYQILLDLKVPKGMAVRTEPHPRFYTDPTDTVPIACRRSLRGQCLLLSGADIRQSERRSLLGPTGAPRWSIVNLSIIL